MKGREAVQKLLTENFQANPGVTLDLTVDEVKQLSPDVRVNRGLATVTPKSGAAVATRYVSDERQKWRSMADLPTHRNGGPGPQVPIPNSRHLEWLVGTWENKAGDQTVETKIDWAGDKNFLVRTFKVKGTDQE